MQLLGENAAFVSAWGNWIIVISFILILGLFFFSLARIKTPKLRAWIVLALLFLLVVLTTLAMLVNSGPD